MDKEFFRIDFKDENALSDLLSSPDSNAQKIRDGYVARLKNGENLMAVIAGFPSCALVLESSQAEKSDGDASSDRLIAIPLS